MLKAKRLWDDLQAVRRHADGSTFLAYTRGIVKTCPAIIRTNTLLAADAQMRGRSCTFTPIAGRSISLDGSHFSGAREMYCRRVYFRVPGFDITANDVVVDVGANRGLFTTMAAVYGRRVLAIEAQQSFVPAIKDNLERNGCLDKARIEVALVGDASGLLRTSEAETDSAVWEERPPVVAMTDLLNRHGIEHVDLMKIDIEGSEFALLSADVAWLDIVDRLVMEVHTRVGGNVPDLQAVLHGFGFSTVMTEAHTADRVPTIAGECGYLYATRGRR